MLLTTRSVMNFGDCWSTAVYSEKVTVFVLKP